MARVKDVRWSYTARNSDGVISAGIVLVSTAVIARVKVRNLGLEPLDVKKKDAFWNIGGLSRNKAKEKNAEKNLKNFSDELRPDDIHSLVEAQTGNKENKKKVKKKIKDKDVTVFIKQFSVVIKSGVPLLKAFDIVINGIENKSFVEVLTDIRFGIESGLSLNESFGAYPKIFDALFINFLAIGEQGGILEPLLAKYLEYKEKTDAIKRKVKSALAYPVIVMIVATLVLAVILGFVVPQFEEVFKSVGAELPAPTLIVIALSDVVVNYWWLVLFLVVAAIIAFRKAYSTVARFRFFIDKFIFRVPLFGELALKTLVSRWTRTLSLLFAAGVPLNSALKSIAFLVDNYFYGAVTLNVQKDVESGNSLHVAMETSDAFPVMVNQMVAVGEEAGSLEFLLLSISDYYDQETEMVIETILSLIEPVTIVFLGVVLGAIIVAIYLPLFHLGDVVG